jgi:hypothetical protein
MWMVLEKSVESLMKMSYLNCGLPVAVVLEEVQAAEVVLLAQEELEQ